MVAWSISLSSVFDFSENYLIGGINYLQEGFEDVINFML